MSKVPALADGSPPEPAAVGPRAASLDLITRQLIFLSKGSQGSLIGVTSAVAGEGTTSVARELARGLAEMAPAGDAVLLLDCGPSGFAGRRTAHPGFDERSIDGRALSDLRLDGQALRGPTVPLAFQALRAHYAFSVLDLPPLLDDPLAVDLAREVDWLYFVVRAGVTRASVLHQALDLVGRERVEGIILNAARPTLPRWLARLVG